MAKAKAKVLTRLRIDEVSSVDRGAGEGVKITLMKRDFSAKERRAAAASGAAMPDGSFPIHNEEDLQNAMRLAGKAKDPKAAKAHIKERARALGLTSALSDSYKRDDAMSYDEQVSKFFGSIFGTSAKPRNNNEINEATAALAKSIASIEAGDPKDRAALLAKTFEQFHGHINKLSADPAGGHKGEEPMSTAVLKALGLEGLSEEDMLKKIEQNNKVLADAKDAIEKAKAKFDEDEEKEDEDEKDDEKKKAFRAMSHAQRKEHMRKKHSTDLHPEIQKILKQAAEDRARVEKLENERELIDIKKVCVDAGMADGEAEIIQKAYKGDKVAVDKLIAHVKAANNQVKAAGVWKELGSTGGDRVGSTAMDLLNAKAAEYRKAHPDLSEQQAFSKVYQDPANAKLVQQERSENRPAA